MADLCNPIFFEKVHVISSFNSSVIVIVIFIIQINIIGNIISVIITVSV